jgi:shikimate kinase
MTAIVLVGLMGAGKSTVGRIVAQRLGRPLLDSDQTIEASTGSSVRELWESGGEASYRQLESAFVLDAIPAAPPAVIAAPGGVVLDPAVRSALQPAYVVWLRGEPGTLASRVRPDDHRPLLGADPKAVLTAMATERANLYRQVADAIIDIDGLDAERVADRVVDLYTQASLSPMVDAD